jgi:type I restriction enzyme, S subunit
VKLRTDTWGNVLLDDVAEITSSKRIFYSEYVDEGIPFFRSKEIIDLFNKRDIKTELFIREEKFEEIRIKFGVPEKDDILLTAVGTIGIPYLVKETDRFYFKDGNLIWFKKPKKSLIMPEYLYMLMQSSFGQDKFKAISSGTAQAALTIKGLKRIEIPLPPLEEQKQIAALFQSIETAMKQVDGQEKKLTFLQKTLVNGLLSIKPVFGNLLNKNNCTPTKFAAIAECDKKYEEHKNEVSRFVGLENIEPENFQLQGCGHIEKGTTFTKRFVKGDVLFCKRRAYLKKVAVADFDGVCSGDILVLRAKEKQILPQLLPFYVSADAFIHHAVSTSAGSLSPRTKWKDLAELQVSMPDLETQKQIVGVLEGIMKNIEQLKHQKTTLKNLKHKLLSEILG